MQYILTEEEYSNLVPIDEKSQRDHALYAARELILKLSKFPCGKTYCDQCPISIIGGATGITQDEVQKNHINSKLICGEYRQYSK